MKTVDFELIKKIRNHITRTEKQAILLPERKKWLQLTAALDVLEDTSWAVEYYIENEYPTDVKGKYLFYIWPFAGYLCSIGCGQQHSGVFVWIRHKL